MLTRWPVRRTYPLSRPAYTHRHGSAGRCPVSLYWLPSRLPPRTRPAHLLDVARVTSVGEALRKSPYQPRAAVNLPQQRRTGVRGNHQAIELHHNGSSAHRFKLKQFRRTLCWHRGAPRIGQKSLPHNYSRCFAAPMRSNRLKIRANAAPPLSAPIGGNLACWCSRHRHCQRCQPQRPRGR